MVAIAETEGAKLHHVKPHGALYLQMASNIQTARAVAQAVNDGTPNLPLVILAGSGGDIMRRAATEVGTATIEEGFPDRAYLPSGQLAPRNHPQPLILEPADVAQRAVSMASLGEVVATDGTTLSLRV